MYVFLYMFLRINVHLCTFFQLVQVVCFSTQTKPYITVLDVARDLKISPELKDNYFSTP